MEQLGKGAAGTVFRARDSLLGIDVCVKVLHQGLSTQPGIIERFKRELLLARRIAHPGICKIFDIQEANGTNFLTMEYVKGETLSAILNRDGQMAAKDAVRLMRKVSEALGAAHKAGVVHRDIKPGNIIIGDGERVTIVDFGVATAEDLDRLTRAGVVLGSRSYMAPETWQGKSATASGDVWALGVILYGCVTGRLPYKGEGVVGVFDAIKNTTPMPPSAVNSDVTPELEELIFKAMCVEPADRFQDAAAVESALASLELTLGDDGAATVVRAPSFASGAGGGSSPAGGAAKQVPSHQAPTTANLSKSLPEPPRPTERLHRPGPTSLPRPPSSFGAPSGPAPKAALPKSAKSTEEISLIGDEMSLYAPAEVSGIGAERDDDAGTVDLGEATRIVAPPSSRDDVISAENVAAAFDAAFDLPAADDDGPLPGSFGSPPHTSPESAAESALPPTVIGPPQPLDDDMAGMNLLLGQKVISGDGAERPPPSSSSSAWEVQPSDAALDFDGATRVQATSFENVGEAAAPAPNPLATLDIPELEPAEKTTVSQDPLSLYQSASDDFFSGGQPADSTRIEPFPRAPDDENAFSQDEPLYLDSEGVEASPYAANDLVPAGKRPDKRLFLAAGGALLLVVVVVAVALGGGDDEPAAEDQLAAAGATTGPNSGDPGVATEEGWVFPEHEGKDGAGENAAAAASDGEEAVADDDKAAAADDSEANEAAASDENESGAALAAAEDPAAAAAGADEAAAADEAAPEDTVADEAVQDDVGEDEDEPAVAAAAADEPAAVATKPRKQRSSGQAAAKSKYKKRRSALNSALARKGLLPGDDASVDQKRRAMTTAARRGDYARAAEAADGAISEIARVSIDARFVGKKLARFNQGYDKTKDEALRGKLKGVLKEVGADYSKGRYDDANKKLNRAFSLMGR